MPKKMKKKRVKGKVEREEGEFSLRYNFFVRRFLYFVFGCRESFHFGFMITVN